MQDVEYLLVSTGKFLVSISNPLGCKFEALRVSCPDRLREATIGTYSHFDDVSFSDLACWDYFGGFPVHTFNTIPYFEASM